MQFSCGIIYTIIIPPTAGKSEEETLEELSSRATSRMASGATSRRSRAPTAMGISTIMEEEGSSTTQGAGGGGL